MLDENLTCELLRELLAIDSVSPSLAPDARGEVAAVKFLYNFLRRHGVEARLQESAPGRPNAVALAGQAVGF